MITRQMRFRGCLLGLAIGDAVGTALEFKPRGSFEPITDMVGGGPFELKPGQWTDDTSMALCLATSLVEKGGFDARDQMERYCRWKDKGYLSSTGNCFDIGGTVRSALERFKMTGQPISGSTHEKSAGNGSIMRLAPVAMFVFPNRELTLRLAAESSRTTHGAGECIEACRLLSAILFSAFEGRSKEEILISQHDLTIGTGKIAEIARGAYRDKAEREIRGSGYVVESLEAALWCFLHTETFREAVLRAANLGDDADTTAAVCGQVAGAYYGIDGIPDEWLERLQMKQNISELSDQLLRG